MVSDFFSCVIFARRGNQPYDGPLGLVVIMNIRSFKLSRSEVSRSEVSRSEVSRSEVSRSEVSRSEVSRSEISRSGVSRSEVSRLPSEFCVSNEIVTSVL